MKRHASILFAVCLTAFPALAAEPATQPSASVPIADFPPGYSVTDAKVDVAKLKMEGAAVAKERDEARVALAQSQAQAQQTQVAAEFYKANSERDQAYLRLIGVQQELTKAQDELKAAREKIADLEKRLAPPTAAKPKEPAK